MRQQLKQLGNDQRYTFRATFVRTGFKNSSSYRMMDEHYKPTLLVTDVYADNHLMTDHLWLNYGKNFLRLGRLHPGDHIQFNGRVSGYYKGYYGARQYDYKIERPTKASLLMPISMPRPVLPEDNQVLIGMIMEENKEFYLAQGRPYNSFYTDQYHKWQSMQETNVTAPY